MKHGHNCNNSPSPTYASWQAMLSRCRNPNRSQYEYYGERGITVCPEWLSFERFLDDMGVRPTGTTLDRKNTNKGYYKRNCRWATHTTQMQNTRNTRFLTVGKSRHCLSEWGRITGLGAATICKRLTRGWTVENAIKTPSFRSAGQW